MGTSLVLLFSVCPGERVWTAGLNFNFNAHVVLKADLRRFQEDSSQNRLNVGLGWAF